MKRIRTIWTLVPASDVQKLMARAIRKKAGRNPQNRFGLRSKLANAAMRDYLGKLAA